MEQINVNAPSGHYAVVVRRGVLDRAGALVSALVESSGTFVLSSPRVWKLWGKRLTASFREFGGATKFLFSDKESAKTLATFGKLCAALAKAGADRQCIVVAFGGGVVGDVAGFVAAAYLRGVRVVQVPTTLVAQVDSAIGGKTGVNLAAGKNLVGAFHQPRLVLVDSEVLNTLPRRAYRAGLYEVIKYAVLGDPELFRALEGHLPSVLAREAKAVDWMLPRCVRLKAEIVSRDEHETGLREVLNLGHTFAHALEAATRYKHFLHGEAVGWGLIAAARLAGEMKLLPPEDQNRLVRLVLRVGRLPALPRIAPARWLTFLRADKKVRAGRLRFVLPRRIGQVEVRADVPDAMVLKVLHNLHRGLPG